MASEWSRAISLAWSDWKFETLLSLCAVLALASMLSPILILQGLKNGVTQGMRERLLEDPATLVITPKSDAGQYDAAFIGELAKLPGATYAVGRTRATAADLTFSNEGLRASIALEPSTPGEPLLTKYRMPIPADGDVPEIVLSTPVAKSLNAKVGTVISANLARRTLEGRLESVPLEAKVAGILPPAAADRKMGFIPLALLEDMENYRDNIDVPGRNLPGVNPPRPRFYSSFRLYAKTLDDVSRLEEILAFKKIEVMTRSRDIAAIKSLEGAINQIILIISIAVGAGFIAFMLSSAEGAARRKKRMVGMLRLLGFRRIPLMLYPIAQSFLTTVFGFLLSLLLYRGVAEAIARSFAQKGGFMCVLSPLECICAFLAVLCLSWCASLHAAWHMGGLEPSMVIREV